MIWNIIDGRKRRYRWKEVNAVIEAIENDQSVDDTDTFDEENELAPIYLERKDVSLNEAVQWAEAQPGKVTLYIYDKGDGI